MASVTTTEPTEPRRGDGAARQYPPLLFLLLALVLAMAVLPSSLTLPQANPSQTVEIAPVPPEDDTPPPPLGNVDQLSLGGSDTLNGQGANGADGGGGQLDTPGELPPLPPAAGTGVGKTKTTKRCVQTSNGLRQTQDIVSPPCSADFTGDNGGATYQGVTADEVRLLIYSDGASIYQPTARGTDTLPANTLIDLDQPTEANEIGTQITLRAWLKYFNDRYQTYNRRVHGYIYYGGSDHTQQGRQADAAAAYAKVKPFATVSIAGLGGGADAYNEYMAGRGVLNFGSQQGRSASFFLKYPKLVWGYPPSIEQQAKVYIDYVCTKIKGGNAVDAGGALQGKPRKYGYISTSDPAYPGSQQLAAVIRTGVEACGIKFDGEGKFPVNGFGVDPVTPRDYATKTIAEFTQKGITTILWGGGTESNYSAAALTANYRPEWILAGDGQNDAGAYGVNQAQDVWSHAWNVSPVVRVETLQTQICYQEYRTVDTTAADSDVANFACTYYNDLRQFFSGVQVAGPKLGPTSIDKGYHAIPAVESKDPRIPACFYEPNDYTCVKDAQAMFWDPQGQVNSEQQTGCWRMVDGGERHIAGKWPAHNIDQDKKPGLVCNQYDAVTNINN
jgi:hypothetical protein